MNTKLMKVMLLSFISFFVVYFCGLVMIPPIFHLHNSIVFVILAFTVLSYLRALYVIYND